MSLQERVQAKAEERRWLILIVLCFSLLVIVLDNSILNVAIPRIQHDLHASTSQLQWMVDSYTLVFAGLLLTAGSLGDRFGRRSSLQFGFVVFGIGSLLSALSGNANELIGFRAFMGIGGAFIMPATLSIITNVFPARERGRAFGVWAATAGVAVALGPLTGGALLEHFYWGSVFLVNIPIVIVGVLAGVFLIPDSKDPHARRLDPVGAVLSIAGLSATLYAVIEAPDKGWLAGSTLAFFGVGALLLAAFFVWEVRTPQPMLDFSFFKNPRFSIASVSIMLTFFAMFGSLFVLTQYFQIVIGYTPIQTGVRLLAFAVPMMVIAPLTHRLMEWLGAKVVIATGLALFIAGLVFATGLDANAVYGDMVWRIVIMASGMALIMAPATDSIMGSLPLARAGVGSAVNDTTRQVGGAVGVAVIGSVYASIYTTKVVDGLIAKGASPDLIAAAKQSIGAGVAAANQAGKGFVDVVKLSFVDGFHSGLFVGAGVLVVGLVAVVMWLPARARAEDVDAQHAEHEAARSAVGVPKA
ncbi:MAG: DHA2 family efflux MFS transporter permease subunit [Acidimicrobiia bacterium]|nr:DHA2 family efflux MFS transporter permease subunit [Acidimicrobiia bacterium]